MNEGRRAVFELAVAVVLVVALAWIGVRLIVWGVTPVRSNVTRGEDRS